MLKLIKYEFRKNLYGIAVMLSIIALAQIYFMYACFIDQNRNKALAGAWILFFCAVVCFFMVFAFGIVTYSRELSNKTSYLVFMTPNRSIKIIGSKLLFTFLNGVMVALLLAGLWLIDWKLLMDMWEQEVSVIEMVFDLVKNFGINVTDIAYGISLFVINFLINFFMAVTLAYLCITLTATVLQNRKIKGLISVIVYIFLFYAVNKIGGLLPVLYESPENMQQVVITALPCMVFFLIIIAGAVVGTAQLLDKKVSL